MIPSGSFLKRTCPVVVQCAQAHKKPRWLPVAKSKIYRIPKRPDVSMEERIELKRINNNYKTQIRAIRRFYYEDMIKEKSTLGSASSEMSQRLEAEKWARCIEINDQWNAKVAAEREERRSHEIAKMEEYSLRRMETKDQELREKIAKASEAIRREKELCTTFITPETLDEAIDCALANTQDYNYALDLQGNQYAGRDTPITPTKEKETASS